MREIQIVLPWRNVRDAQKALGILDIANRLYGIPPNLFKSNIKYKLEGRGKERWKTWPIVARDGYGDCEDLSSWLSAQIDGASYIYRTANPKLYHVVTVKNGYIIDPSRALGM